MINRDAGWNNHADCSRNYFITQSGYLRRERRGGRWDKYGRCVSPCEVTVIPRLRSGGMTCQRAGFITAMNPGGSEQLSLSLDGRRGRRRRRKEGGRKGGGDNPAEAFYLNHSSAPFKSI